METRLRSDAAGLSSHQNLAGGRRVNNLGNSSNKIGENFFLVSSVLLYAPNTKRKCNAHHFFSLHTKKQVKKKVKKENPLRVHLSSTKYTIIGVSEYKVIESSTLKNLLSYFFFPFFLIQTSLLPPPPLHTFSF